MLWITTILKIVKPLAPYILAAVAVVAAYAAIYDQGKEAGYNKAIQETAKIVQKLPKCPELKPCDCPPQIDFDKIKSKNVTIQAKTVTNYVLNQDSTFREELLKAISEELDKRKMSRCR